MRRKSLGVSKKDVASVLRSVWLLPLIVTLVLLLLTCLKISGSSVGIYHSFFYGNTKDTNLLYGKPNPIRSDEWLVNTQLTIAQARDNFPRINQNIAGGRDMSLNIDVPYKDWSVIFKPQNIIFFILPLEMAFAFKWWLLLYLLIVGCYFFVLRLFPGKRALATIVSLGFSFSPFVFWWYQSFTLASLFYGFFILILGMRMLDGEPVRLSAKRTLSRGLSIAVYSVALAYLLVSFALVFYPPFQIPVALGVAAYLFGYLLNLRPGLRKGLAWKPLLYRLAPFAVAIFVTGVIGAAFLQTRGEAIKSISHTVYPGARVVASAGFPVDRMLATFLQPQLERDSRGGHYYTNQSESSNFILLLPYILIPGLVLTGYELRKKRHPDWVFICLQLCALLFLADLFVPGQQWLYKLTLLDKVPHERLVMGLGFVGILYMLHLIKKLQDISLSARRLQVVAIAYAGVCLFVAMLVGRYTRNHFPIFITSWGLIGSAAVVFCGIIYLILTRRIILAMTLLLCFSLASVVRIHPLYRGLGPIAHNKVTDSMISLSSTKDSWASLDQIYTENFGLLADRESLSGVQFYPDLDFWRQVEGKKDDAIYNRYAHVVFTANPDIGPLKLAQLDSFNVKFWCSAFIEKNVDYVLAPQPLAFDCIHLRTIITYPARKFWIYQVE